MKTKLLMLISAFLAFSFVHAQDITSDLVVYYHFNGNAEDDGLLELDGTVSGATLVTGHDGTPNGAYSFDGVDDIITFSALPLTNNSFTVSYWLNLPANITANQVRTILSTRGACGEGRFFELGYINSSSYGYAVTTEMRSNTAVGNPNSEYFPGTEQWVHVALVKDNATATNKYYINGVAYDETDWGLTSVDVTSASPLKIGISACDGNGRERFKGSIDELRVYGRALTSEDVRFLLKPELVSTNTASIVQSDFSLKAIFSRDLDANTVNSTNILLKDQKDNTLAATITLDTDTIFVVPDNPLPEGQNITFSFSNLLTSTAESIPDTTLTSFTAFSDLVAAYSFDGNANDNFGSLGNTSVSGAISTRNRLNEESSAYSFDGSNDYMQVADNDLLDFDTDRDLSISLWFKAEQASTTRVFFDKGDGDSRYLGRLRDTGQIDWYLDYGTQVYSMLSNQRYDDGFWHHVAFVLDRSGDQTMYVDGMLEVSSTPSTIGTLTNSLPLRFGSLSNDLTQYMDGSLDDIFIYGKVLSEEEITILSNIGRPTFINIESQSPAPHTVTNAKNTDITLDFDKDLQTTASIDVMGSLSGYVSGTTTIVNSTLSFDPTSDLIYGEEITVIVGGNVSALDGDTLTSPMTYQFRIQPALSPEYPNTLFASDSIIDNFVNGTPSLAAADFDNDGDIDIVGTSGGEGKVTFYENDGSGVFSNQINLITTATSSYDVKVGDINNDGLMDILTSYNQRISWFKNLGSGTFSDENVIASSVGTRYLHIADMNNDGFVDVVHSQYLSEKNIAIYYNNGDETFATNKSLYNAGSTSQLFTVELADINGDNQIDIVFGQLRGGIQYLRNTGNNSFASAVTLVSFPETGTAIFPDGVPMALSVDDMDGDGDNDLVAGSYDPVGQSANVSKVVWAENNGNGTFSSLNTIESLGTNQTNIWEINVNTEDIDGDGDMDILLFAKTGNLSWYENQGQGAFSERKEIANVDPGQVRLNTPQAYDLTGDGALEIVVAAAGQLRYYNNVDQLSVVSILPSSESTNIDLDADIAITFDLEIDVTSITTSTVVLTGSTSGNIPYSSNYDSKVLTLDPTTDFSTNETITITLSGLSGANGEGFSDYTSTFTSFAIGTLAHYPKNGALIEATDSVAIKFNSALTLSSLSNTSLQVMSNQYGLLNGTYEIFEDSTAIFKPDNGFHYGEKITVYTTANIQFGANVLEEMISFDFQVGSLPAEEPITFDSKTISNPISAPEESSLGDYDNDGDLDVFYTDAGGLTAWIENSNGFGSFNTPSTVKFVDIINPLSSTTADLDKDGKVEAIMADYRGGGDLGYIEHYSYDVSSSSWLSTLVFEQLTQESNDIRSIEVADLDLNGQMELITVARNNSSPTLTRWELNADGVLNSYSSFIMNHTSSADDAQVGDIDGDGKPDVVVASGNGTFWYSNEILLDPANFDNSTDRKDINSQNAAYKLALADIDQDGDIDIIQTTGFNQTIVISINDGTGTFTNTSITTGSESTQHIRVGDMDGDGDLDIVYSNWEENAIDWLRNDGNMTFVKLTMANNISEPEGISLGDIDQDGDMDIIAVSSEGGGFIYLVKNLSIDNNLPPSLVNPLASFTINEDDPTTEMITDLDAYFEDAEGDAITYTVTPSTSDMSIGLVNGSSIFLTPGADFFGTLDVVITATDVNGGATDMVVPVTVNAVNDTPSFTLSGDVELDEDFTDAVTVSVTQSQPANEADQLLSYTLTPATVDFATVTIDQSTGEITIVALEDANGNQQFTVSVDDSQAENNTATATFMLTVHAVNDPIELTGTNVNVYNEDFTDEQVIVINADHPLNEADQEISYSIDPLPESISFASIEFDEVLLTITVNAVEDEFGSEIFTLTANDGIETSTIDITVEVISVNDAPNFELSTSNITVGQDFANAETITLTDLSPANESDIITYTLNPNSVSFANVTIDAQTGTISISSVSNGTGSETFTVTANDGDLTASQQFTFEVLANQAPTVSIAIEDQSFTEDSGVQTIDTDVSDNFSDADGDNLTFDVTSDNSGIVATLNGNELSIQSAGNFFGSATILLTASDGSLSVSDDFMVEITSINDIPTIANALQDVSTDEDVSFSYVIASTTFSDVEDETLTISVNAADWLIFDASTMTLSGTPSNDHVGTHNIVVTASDSDGASVSDEFIITVINTNDAPEQVQDITNVTALEDAPDFTLDFSINFEDVDGDALTYTLLSTHSIYTATMSGSVLSISPVADANGLETISFEVSDGTEAITASFTVEFAAVNDAPVFSLSETSLELEANFESTTISIIAGAVPVNEQDQTVNYSLNPESVDFANVTIDATSGLITISAINDASGSGSITVIASDGGTENSTFEATFTLDIAKVLSNEVSIQNTIEIFPNPSSDWLHIQCEEGLTIQSVNIFSLSGKKVYSSSTGISKVDVSSFDSGVYFIELTDEKRKTVTRFIKE